MLRASIAYRTRRNCVATRETCDCECFAELDDVAAQSQHAVVITGLDNLWSPRLLVIFFSIAVARATLSNGVLWQV